MASITQIEYVLAVDKFRHFGRAAESCHVTQPTLSMQLQKLEEELGYIIFDRTKMPILPTEEGGKLIQQGRIILREYNKIFEISQDKGVSGRFRIGVIPTLASTVIPLFLKKFSTTYPGVELIISENKTDDIIELLDKDELDGGILVTPLHESSIIERSLFSEKFYLFAAPGHPLLGKSKIKESDLHSDGLWLLDEGHCMRAQMMNICSLKKAGHMTQQFSSGSLETLKNLVLASGGYTILPQLMIRDMTRAQQKNIRPFVNPTPSREVSLVHSRIFLKEKILNALEEVIIDQLPQEVLSHKKKDLEIIPIT